MNDTEKMEKAINCVECLANGVHPITGEVLKETVFDEPEIIRCLFFVKEVLRGKVSQPTKSKKEGFSAVGNLEDFLQDQPTSLSPFIKKISQANNGVGPSAKKIWDLLVENKFLYEGTNLNGTKTKLPTELGKQSGISCAERQNSAGEKYYVVVYNRKGQELLLDCIRKIYC